jgi:hypothetical protein
MRYVLQCGSCNAILGTREGRPHDASPDVITHTLCGPCNTALEQNTPHVDDMRLCWQMAALAA